MDDELYQAFITESEESITQLNNSLLQLESNPEDQEAIDNIFRRAHTLKGNFGAMGFDTAATIAHAIEDLLDEIRQGRLEVTPERMDLVFEGVDLILDVLHEIEETGESTVDPSETVDALRAAAEPAADDDDAGAEAAEDDDAGAAADDAPGSADDSDAEGADADDPDDAEAAGADDPDDAEGDAADGDGDDEAAHDELVAFLREAAGDDLDEHDRVLHVAIDLDVGEMKSVDAGLFLDSVPDSVSVVAADPGVDEIRAGEFEDGFELYVAGLGAEETATTFADLWSVSEATVTDLSGALGLSGGDGGAADEGSRDATEEDDGDASASSESDSSSSGSSSSSKGGGSSGDGRSISEVKSVRVDVDQLDELHELVEQLVTSRIKLRRALDGDGDADGLDTMDELDKISSNLQNTVMDMRLIPLKKVFDKFPRLVRDLAREQDKRVNFEVEGQDIELDRTILDEISDPLMHVLRNAVDHGIEPPEERAAAGKPETGTIELRAEREHDTVVITVEDDGGGVDVDAVKDKAVSKGLATRSELESLPDEEIYDYILEPGFSTNDEITDVSGRGVGMDVVKTTVEALDGSVSVTSTPGEGTTFRIRLPVSVAIIKVLFVEVGDREFGVPIKYIDEIGRMSGVESINGVSVVVHEDTIFPLIPLRNALDVDAPLADDPMVVRIRPVDRQVALRCDRVTRQEEVVVTPLQGPLSGAEGLSGTAVIGDGNVIPILDVGTLDLPRAAEQVMYQTPPGADGGSAGGSGDAEEAAD